MAPLPNSPIDRLLPELLLEIFDLLALESRKSTAPLFSSILCCRKWRPLASSVLYRHVILDQKRLEAFVVNRPKCKIASLTVIMDLISVYSDDLSPAIAIAKARKDCLRKLSSVVGELNPTTLSLAVDLPFPCNAVSEIVAILGKLPESCTALEIDLKYSSSVVRQMSPESTLPQPHLCDSIRRVLPQLEHLRLRLPLLCPSIFCGKPPAQGADRQIIRAPLLKTCLINLAFRQPNLSDQGAWTGECRARHDRSPHIGQLGVLPSALPPMEGAIKDFAEKNSNNLKRLWVMDLRLQYLIRLRPHSYPGWVRRDFLSKESFPIPIWDVNLFSTGVCAARIPSPTDSEEVKDLVSHIVQLEAIAEGETWTETQIGARLPTRDVNKFKPHRDMLIGSGYRKSSHTSKMLWENENATGVVLLPRGPGELMKQWELVEITPRGWTRSDWDGSPMTRIE
ncbi:hypothetical protein F5Y01DRAFT_307938 [Xylaria sp. FL0043]|nr:hypothetical protein F5Y01DRAFT_307938 [Xylaria sp. FL0043]